MLFEKLIIKRIRDTNQPVTISTGIAFGHKILTIGAYRFIEIDDNKVAVEGDKFNIICTKWEDIELIYSAVR